MGPKQNGSSSQFSIIAVFPWMARKANKKSSLLGIIQENDVIYCTYKNGRRYGFLTLLPPSVREYCVPPAAGLCVVVFLWRFLRVPLLVPVTPRSIYRTILSLVFRAIFCYRKKLQHYIVRSTPTMVDPNPAMLFKEPCALVYTSQIHPRMLQRRAVLLKRGGGF